MGLYSIIFDIILLVIIVATAIVYAKKGFVRCLVSFLGTFAALLISIAIADTFSPVIFNNVFRAGLEQQVSEIINVGGSQTVNDVLASMFSFLSPEAIASATGAFGATLVATAPEIARNIVDNVIMPVVVPMITFVVFMIAFIILRILLGILGKVLGIVNRIPVIGSGNKILGFAAGACIGLLYAYILLCLVWGINALYGGGEIVQQIVDYSIFAKIGNGLNPFTQVLM